MEEYYYLDQSNERKGPVAVDKLLFYGVTKETLVWKNGMVNWQAAGMVPELAFLFSDQTIPPVAPTPPPAQKPAKPQPPFKKPDNNLVWAILTTVLCCLPFGVAAIVYSTKVDSAWNSGNYDEALDAARKAATFSWISAGCGLFFGLAYIIIVVVAGVGSAL
ncbi:CD225/dispanin family protein [Bacteroides sp. 51]|uniref:CD225/dispanin family protein n=1 Tax=Bacteroides sp. 51 TaxID=2302938 RepID=UPI0013CF66E3|nr:CD225/dispanin family protein [Bacteroides sp. 51]NDV80998.1 DUF4339 domain-containing protein [Bacteroides sp. 51]